MKTKRIAILFVAALLMMNSILVAFAGSTTILSEKTGVLGRGESKRFDFSIPQYGAYAIRFIGWTYKNESRRTYGGADLEIIDEDWETVFFDTVYTEFDDLTVHVTLSKGEYTMILKENDSFTFDYCFSITTDNGYAGDDNHGYEDEPVDISIKSIKLNRNKVSMSVNKTTTLKATYEPSYVDTTLFWSSSNDRIATVSQTGTVKAKTLGVARITANAKGKEAHCTVVVNKTTQQIFLSESKSLRGHIKNISGFENATWSSSNKSIVSVSKSGKATAKAIGKADITVKIEGQNYTIRVTVPKIKLNQKQAEMHPGEVLRLSMIGTNKEITWKSSNKSVATVSKTGVVKAKSYGNAVITATVDGKKYACKVNVNYQTYGDVQGTVTYYFNRNYGQVPDVGARIYILDTSKKSIVSSGMADGNGNYEITGIPTGKYELVIVSAHATCLLDEDIADYYAEYGIFTYLKQIGRCDITLEEDMVITANKSFTVSSF